MKILIIRNFPSYMAVKNNTYNIQEIGLAKALVRKGNICDILFWTDKKEEDITISVDDCGEAHVFYRQGKTKLKNTIFRGCDDLFEKYDVLQPCEYNQIQSWLLARRYPHKTVIYHGPYYSNFNKRYNLVCKVFDALFLKSYIKLGTRFIAKSSMAKEFLENKGIKPEDVCVAGVGIDTQMLSTKESICEEMLYLQMKEDADSLRILYVGRLEERRNIPYLLDVFSEVKKKCSIAKLYVIGTGDEDYVKMVFDYAQELGIRDDIVWQERMEQKYLSEVYQLADFFLLATHYEIFGMVLLEAMYYRTVVLTTKNGGSSTLIDNEKSGYIIELKNKETWADIIVETYSDRMRMEQIQDNASKTIKENFTWDKLVDTFLEQYRICLLRREK